MVEVLRAGYESNDCYDRLREDLRKLESFTDDFIDDIIERTRRDESLYKKWADYAASQLEEMSKKA